MTANLKFEWNNLGWKNSGSLPNNIMPDCRDIHSFTTVSIRSILISGRRKKSVYKKFFLNNSWNNFSYVSSYFFVWIYSFTLSLFSIYKFFSTVMFCCNSVKWLIYSLRVCMYSVVCYARTYYYIGYILLML